MAAHLGRRGPPRAPPASTPAKRRTRSRGRRVARPCARKREREDEGSGQSYRIPSLAFGERPASQQELLDAAASLAARLETGGALVAAYAVLGALLYLTLEITDDPDALRP